MSLIRYRAFPMTALQQQVNRMFDQFDNDFFSGSEGLGGGMFTPAVDVKEDADSYTVHLEAPGLKQEQLQITLQDNVLTIRGRKEQSASQNDHQFRRIERSYGSFARSITLPRAVDASQVNAHLEDGLLEVRLPKLEGAKPRQISIGATQTIMQNNTPNEHAPHQIQADGDAILDTSEAPTEEAPAPTDGDPQTHEPTGSPEGTPS